MAHIPQGLGWTIKKKGPYQLIQEASKAEINENPHLFHQKFSKVKIFSELFSVHQKQYFSRFSCQYSNRVLKLSSFIRYPIG